MDDLFLKLFLPMWSFASGMVVMYIHMKYGKKN